MTADDGDLTLFGLDYVPGICNPGMGIRDPGAPPPYPPGQGLPRDGQQVPQAGAGPPRPPGHARPRNGQHLPQAVVAVLWAFDWAVGRGVSAVDPQGWIHRFGTLDELLRAIPRGVTLVGESTFESYDVGQREHILALAASRDIDLRTVPARGNTRRRAVAGMPEKTSQSRRTDEEDARAIWWAAVYGGAHLKKPAPVDPAWAELRDRAAARLRNLRRSGQKDTYARGLAQRLPHFTWQPTERRTALGQDGTYSLVIAAAVGVAAEFTANRTDFERLTGLYAHGYPSQFRSDLMHWGWGRRPGKRDAIPLSVYRRELRWLFHQFRP